MAMAPERAGIGLRRHFTAEGTDAYDEVAWEVRDARITNYRDGTVAFEQRDVEFPVSWSQNATNIVAQKYFRGALGSPERERSLRQVIDRVADTITNWGRKDGYFVDADEAAAFRAELKHLVVTQKAAFNSPVWFNIGVAGEPQQASACQPWHALVSTPEGLVPIGALVEENAIGTKVCDAHGLTSVVAVKANGRKTVLRVRTSAGYVLDVTADHLVWRARTGLRGPNAVEAGEFVPAGSLARGDQLEWHQTESWGNGQITRGGVAEAAVAGWIQAGGFVVDVRGKGVAGGEVTVAGEAEEQWLRQSLATALPQLRAVSRRSPQPGVPGVRLRLEGTGLAAFVQKWGLARTGAAASVPAGLFTAPLPVAAAYLRSMFQAEGWLSETGSAIGLAMASEEVVRGVQSLLLRFDVFSKVRRVAERRAGGNNFWVLNVTVSTDGHRFADEIGFIDPDRSRDLEAALAKSAAKGGGSGSEPGQPVRLVEVESIDVLGEMAVYDIQTESGEYLSGNLRVHNCFILAVDDTMKSILNWYVEEGTIFKGGSGAGINLSNIRSSQETLKGGGLASGPVSFMRGADASAGTIKCLHADTLIPTDQGVVPIKEVQAGWRVPTRLGERPVEAVHDNGVRPLVRVRTELGDEILCTPEHRFWVRGQYGEGWREAGQLRPDDYLVVDLSAPFAGAVQPLDGWCYSRSALRAEAVDLPLTSPFALQPKLQLGGRPPKEGFDTSHLVQPEPRPTRETRHSLPGQLDEPFALWLGWVFGDGSITERPGTNFVAVQIGDKDEELAGRSAELTKGDCGDRVHLVIDRHADRADASLSARFCSTQLLRFLKLNGLGKGKAGDVRIPALVQSSPAPVRAAFLSGLFEADGHIGNGYPTLSTVSHGLALDVHRLLLTLGIPSVIGRIDDRVAAYGTRSMHTVRVVGGEGVRRFAKLIGFVSERKSKALDAAVERKDASPFETKWYLPHVDSEFSSMWEVATGELSRALAPYCRYANVRRLSLLRARALLERFPDQLHGAPFARFAAGDEIYVKATVEPAGEGPTFDLTVQEAHEYLVDNLWTHNSGGKTRRAAKMVILNADHPDVEDFIWCKAVEERKARVLRDAGFDMDLDGKDSHSTQYQNANNSVRVTDDFMRAVVEDRDWPLRAVTTGDTVKSMRARDLFRQIAEAAWECADPGMQFDTTINRWHTASNTGRINGSNPCFPGDQLVHTDKGLIRFDELFDRARTGEAFGVYTHDATNPDAPADRLEITRPEAFMITGWNEIVRLRFDTGMELRCTPNHALFTVNRGWVAAADLTSDDEVKVLDLPAPAVNADLRLPVSVDTADYAVKRDRSRSLALPEKWTPEFAHYLGWLVGDGCIAGNVVTTVYGGGDGQEHILPRHLDILADMNGGRAPKPSVQQNGTVQLRQSRRVIARFLEALGIGHRKAPDKGVPWSIEQAPPEAVAAFLQGLFDADGCVYDGSTNRYVGLGSASPLLLQGTQRLLATFGISSRIYATRKGPRAKFSHTDKSGRTRAYVSKPMFALRIANSSIREYADRIGFSVPAKGAKLETLLAGRPLRDVPIRARLVERIENGVELTYNLSEPRNHSYVVQALAIRNCSEYMHLDNSACNLASLNLLKFLEPDGQFDVEGFKQAVEVVFTAQEILVGNADYPTEKIAENSRRFRQLGLGYANLGALLMALGMPYDSDEGRAWAGSITALMTGHAYATSARIASRMGPFAGYTDNAEPMNRVLAQHRDASMEIEESLVPVELLSAAQESWEAAVELCEWFGVRNSQATVLAPTGCLVGGSLVATDRGLVRLRSLGEPYGEQWQELDVEVATDQGPRTATNFYVNGLEPVVTVGTGHGYRIQGTPTHRVKVVHRATGEWGWRRFADIRPGNLVPLALGQMVGGPQPVVLAPIETDGTGDEHLSAPSHLTIDLAELVGYFMGDGLLHNGGLRFSVDEVDFDVVERLCLLGKETFGIAASVSRGLGSTEVAFNSRAVAAWWKVCGFAKRVPGGGFSITGSEPHLPDAILHTNDPEVYRSFLRGLFEADGAVWAGVPSWSTTAVDLAHDVHSVLLALGFPTTLRTATRTEAGIDPLTVLRLVNTTYADRWLHEIGFIGDRKNGSVNTADTGPAVRHDHIPLSTALIDRLAPGHDALRRVLLVQSRRGTVTRRVATELFDRTGDAELGHLLGFFYDRVTSAELGGEQFTYDLSVPDNVTYVANGFVSHNTIGLMMDCDTTGIEPDLGLCKTKKLVGGGTMSIVNQTVPRALRRLGYTETQVVEIIAYIDEHKSIVGAPHLSAEHLPVFACSMGDNVIHYSGHVRMMGAAQPFISGAISKCVTGETLVTSAEGLMRIGSLHDGEAADTFRDEVVEVASLNGAQKTQAFYYGGVRPVWQAVLGSGHRVVGTPNHRLLVAGRSGVEWRRLDEIERGDHVAVQYGADLWSVLPARFDDFVPSPPSGPQKRARIPAEMNVELALLLGAYAAEGHTTRANWTVTITNACPEVLERVASAWQNQFGLTARVVSQPDRCPSVAVSSKTVVEFLEHLGCGGRASSKRIPDAVLRSPREMVVAFLRGLALDACTTVATAPTWGICLDAPLLLDDLQAILTNLGFVHGRVTRRNRDNGKTYDEVYLTGSQAQAFVRLVPFLERDKAARAEALLDLALDDRRNGADVVPGIAPADLYRLLPAGRRSEFTFLCDLRTISASRDSVERVAAVPGVKLPPWLQMVLADGLHFSPVSSIGYAGEREVFDLSVPATQAFVGNGIVNHNTINTPEDTSVEEIEQLHVDAWRLGLKAVAIYRDNCKVAQPLSTTKKEPAAAAALLAPAEKLVSTVVVREPVREKLPRTRNSKTFSFRVADCHGYVTVGQYADGRPGEIFLKVAKQGSTLAGIMDAFAISVSHGLQYGVPLKAFVEMYTNMRFEPAGMTDDPDIRFASSLVDYIFRRLAVEYLDVEERAELGILTIGERMQPTLPGVEESVTPTSTGSDVVPDPARPAAIAVPPAPTPAPAAAAPQPAASDAPYCYQCGMVMQRAGACFVCSSCGTTSGCS
ncbi:MAG: LAGLIDADG family homing endonuclease [Acidimicrobiales bacterium]